ncbi:hypothetical protein M8013_19370 [Enterobacteriaceae bacterium H4N4]|uniref:Uncharacterized protein n=1 Tax=Silvania confinis TaxID=2926470 RepID=A0A9J6QRQ6_9ENTR|nr:hypothetical protein [Silvania confinis]MCU6670893.1 hypothetical protein [Silvania confinis]
MPKGSHQHHVWHLSTPCVDFADPVKMVILCMTMRYTKTAFFSSFNVFAKAQGIVKAKHRILVQHAGYSLRPAINPHLIDDVSTDCPAGLAIKSPPLNSDSLPSSITTIVNKIAVLFFYGNKFPTIRENICKQQWGSHGHGQTQ